MLVESGTPAFHVIGLVCFALSSFSEAGRVVWSQRLMGSDKFNQAEVGPGLPLAAMPCMGCMCALCAANAHGVTPRHNVALCIASLRTLAAVQRAYILSMCSVQLFLQVLVFVSAPTSLLLFLASAYYEVPHIIRQGVTPPLLPLLAASIVSALVNITSYAAIASTSSLTYKVAGGQLWAAVGRRALPTAAHLCCPCQGSLQLQCVVDGCGCNMLFCCFAAVQGASRTWRSSGE